MRFLGALLVLFSLASHAHAQVVVIDPGHGGTDSGAVGCSLQEADVVLDVSQRAATLLREADITVHLTRDDDRFIELAARATFANSRGAALFVSVHANANEGTPATGTETFVYTTASAESRELGQEVQDELIATWGLRDRMLKFANFSVLRRTSMPAALAELAFINRCDPDAALLGSPAERARIAAALARAILATLGRTGPIDPPTTGRLIGVSFEDTGMGLEDTSVRIPAAMVRVGDEVLTSGDDGLFAFNLTPGSYEVEVSMPGFATATRECMVNSGVDNWCSVGLMRSGMETRTRVVGYVYEDNGGDMATAPRLGGALVDYGAGDVTTDAAGDFAFEVASGPLTLSVSRAGYMPASLACTASGAETTCAVGLVPVSTTSLGTLEGIVHVAGDLEDRIEDASVFVRELGIPAESDASGVWSLELPEGSYNIDFTAAGYVMASEQCTVRTGEETTCNAGLTLDEEGPGPEMMPMDEEGCGCSAAGSGSSSSSTLWVFGLLGLLVFQRRRSGRASSAGLVLAALFVLAGCSGAPEAAASSQAIREAPQDSELMLAAEVAPFAALENVQEMTQGDFIDLELSPDAQHIALSHARYAALSVLSLETRELRLLREAPQAGYEPRWHSEGQVIGVRTEGQTSTATPTLAFSVDGTEADPFRPSDVLSVRVEEDVVVMRSVEGDETRLGPPGDRYFDPRASADGEYVSFRGLSSGLYIHRRADGATFMVGAGAHVRFDASGRWMVFVRNIEDGHERTGSALYVMDLSSDELRYGLIATDAVRPDAPSIAGGKLAFMDEGSARIGDIRFEE
ncbi:MAG: N-acetylmuramoyl-L-alanine amidase [Polyangiales bacterium]